jgi:hypothetical protein
VKKPKKPNVKSFSAIQKKTNRNLSLPQEPMQNPAKSLPQTNAAGHQQDQQMGEPPKRWSLRKRAVAAVVGLIAPKERKGP